MSSESSSRFSLRSILEKDKLTGTNFLDWYRNLRIVLKQEKKDYVLEEPVPAVVPIPSAPHKERDAYKKHVDDSMDVGCLMLATMSSELQIQYENAAAYDIIEGLKGMFQEQARVERCNIVESLTRSEHVKGSPVSPHVLKMIGYVESLGKLDCKIPKELATDIILNSLSSDFDSFVMNFNMHNMDKSLAELHGMLKSAELKTQKQQGAPPVLMVRKKAKGFKKPFQGNQGKGKAPIVNQAKMPKPGASSEDVCHFCNGSGHWKRNCKKFLETLKNKKDGGETSRSGIYVIEVNVTLSNSTSWVLDTACGAHICIDLQGLTRSRMLAKDETEFRVGNGAKVVAAAVGTFHLTLPSGLVLELNNCYYVPAIRRNIISIPCLDTEGFKFDIENNCCSFYRSKIFYGNALLSNGLYVLNFEVPVCNINTKRAKSNDLNPTYL